MDRTALYHIDDERKECYTFRDFYFISNRFANLLIQLDIKKGDTKRRN